MSGGDLIVAAVIVLLVVAAVACLINNRRKGIGSCGCKCGNCRCCGNKTQDSDKCENCVKKN